jgi:hypothetical protein
MNDQEQVVWVSDDEIVRIVYEGAFRIQLRAGDDLPELIFSDVLCQTMVETARQIVQAMNLYLEGGRARYH